MPADIATLPQWNGWGLDLANSRYQPNPGLTSADVPNLKLKWAFGFAGGSQAYGQPAIVAGRVFVGSDTGRFYVLEAGTGCIQWSFQADGGIRSAPSVAPLKPGTGGRYAVYFGDLKAAVYAIDATSGELIWKKRVDDHQAARVTGRRPSSGWPARISAASAGRPGRRRPRPGEDPQRSGCQQGRSRSC